MKLPIVALAALVTLLPSIAPARDDGQWSQSSPSIRNWFQSLMQPDNPAQSCCGEADAFEADTFATQGDHYVAIITDGKGVIPAGTRIGVPNQKMKWDRGNPTGHGIVFLSGVVQISPIPGNVYVLMDGNGNARLLYCYVAPAGI